MASYPRSPYSSLVCPCCQAPLTIEDMLDASVFFGPGAIVFDCPGCHNRLYFSPFEDFIETGTLAAAPVIDTIPYAHFAYPEHFEMQSMITHGILSITIQNRTWTIPRYGINHEAL